MCLVLVLLCSVLCAGSAAPGADKYVKQMESERLTSKSHQAFLESGNHLIIFYYLQDTKPLPAFAKMYARIKDKITASWPQFRLAYIDASRDHELLDDLNTDDLPLVQIFLYGIPIIYNSPDGSMNFSELPEYIDKVMGRTCETLAAGAPLGDSELNYEAFYFSKERPEAEEIMGVLCAKFDDSARIFRVTDPALMASIARRSGFEIEVADFLLIGHRKHDQQSFLFESKVQAVELFKFIHNTQSPLSSHLTEKTLRWAVHDQLELVVFFYQNVELVEQKIELLKSWVQEVNDASMLLTLANMNEDFVKEFVAANGIESSAYSLFVIKPYAPGMPKFKFPGTSFSLLSVMDFWASYNSKSLKRFYKSQKPSDLPDALGTVTVASTHQATVGSDFKQRVLDNTEHHCVVLFHDDSMQQTVEEFQAAADELRISSVRFYRFNTARNENVFVDETFHKKVLLYPRLDDQVAELQFEGEVNGYLLLDFLKENLP